MFLRRFLISSSLILSPLGFGSAAFAQTTSTIDLSLTVPATASIALTATAEASNLQNSIQLAQTGIQTPIKIADFTVTTNAVGVTLTASSTNNGQLRSQAGDFIPIPYKIQVQGDGGAVPNSVNFSTLNNFSRYVSGNIDLYIEIENPGSLLAGTYTDTLTLTISTDS
ncbi:hypothetical protein NWP21_04605 [Anabaenopsis sp. FSS-46]|uniref:hypothetical protein n=1 Tax=Anabaenopsis sp. FSS-46 TaxID=2971766 RepID=UPI0024730CF2|nr:hypothetical protein [Anabaenopsis sp. FSS-46]MDH6098133.1 hypothetical protein [Anabaenopsis sp. FSS-46]